MLNIHQVLIKYKLLESPTIRLCDRIVTMKKVNSRKWGDFGRWRVGRLLVICFFYLISQSQSPQVSGSPVKGCPHWKKKARKSVYTGWSNCRDKMLLISLGVGGRRAPAEGPGGTQEMSTLSRQKISFPLLGYGSDFVRFSFSSNPVIGSRKGSLPSVLK